MSHLSKLNMFVFFSKKMFVIPADNTALRV